MVVGWNLERVFVFNSMSAFKMRNNYHGFYEWLLLLTIINNGSGNWRIK